MKIWKNIDPKHIVLNASAADKEAVLRLIADHLAESGVIQDAERFFSGLKEREAVLSTGIGNGIAIPHAVSTDSAQGVALLVRLQKPVDFDAVDAQPVDLVLALALPAGNTSLHLQLLASIARLCQEPGFLEGFRTAANPQNLLDTIRNLEETIPFH